MKIIFFKILTFAIKVISSTKPTPISKKAANQEEKTQKGN
jgi:hypothetical protein